jgi:hypothetical protein
MWQATGRQTDRETDTSTVKHTVSNTGRYTFEKIGEDDKDDRKMYESIRLEYLSPSTKQ